jgi:molecular chaperone GrpE
MNANVQSAADSQNGHGELERLTQELRREHEMHLRALADFENYRRRVERERVAAALAGKREIILSVIDALDSFDRALEQMGHESVAVIEGLQTIRRKLMSTLEAHGVSRYESQGQKFDPSLHEAAGTVETDRCEPGVVANVIREGYRWGDEVLRPAHVLVAR